VSTVARRGRRALGWVFINRHTGAWTVAQWPNPPLLVFVATALLLRFLGPTGAWETALRTVSILAIGLWAVDEVIRGVNPFRRALGALVLAATVASIASG
jgi:hypothetical protein